MAPKMTSKKRARDEEAQSGGSEAETKPAPVKKAKSKASNPGGSQVDAEGNPFWEVRFTSQGRAALAAAPQRLLREVCDVAKLISL